MKKILFILTMILTVSVSMEAMSYEQARREALFLTDKMAYELNLNEHQYDAAYEINLDYLMGVTGVDNVYGNYWTRRNLDISYILLDWQWNAFRAASYFYRPLYYSAGAWHFGIYARYPHRHYLYFNHPSVYVSYCGAHGWRHHGERSYYYGHRKHYHNYVKGHGMRDRWDRGDFKNNHKHNKEFRVPGNRKDYGRPTGNYKVNTNSKPNNKNNGSFKPNNDKKNNNANRPNSGFKPNDKNSRPSFNSRPSGSPRVNAAKGNGGSKNNGNRNNGNRENKNGAFGGRR